MPQHRFNIINIFLVVIVLQSATALAQLGSLPAPEAFYSLRTRLMFPNISYAKYILAETWDKSGNGRHGNYANDLVLSNGNITGWSLEEGRFPENGENHTTNVKKTNRDIDTTMFFPEPFTEAEVRSGITVTFWYKNIGTPVDGIIATKYFQFGTANKTFRIKTKRGEFDNNFLRDTTIFDGENGWYFIAVILKASGPLLYSYHYENPYSREKEKLNQLVLQKYTPESSPHFSIDSGNGLMCQEFDGELRDVRFFKQVLNKDQINAIRNLDYDWSQGKISTESQVFTGNFRYYPISQSNKMADSMHANVAGTISNEYNVMWEEDRHGRKDALKFVSPEVYCTLNDLFENGEGNPKYDPQKGGYTISMWVKSIGGGSFNTPINTIERPFGNKDTRFMFFYGYDSKLGHYTTGINRINDRLGTIRSVLDKNKKWFPWTFWYYDNVSFRDRQDQWLHLVYVQHPNWQRVYLEGKDADLGCDFSNSDYGNWANCKSRYNYQGIPKQLANISEWGLGNRYQSGSHDDGPLGTINYSSDAICVDDVRIYRWPLSRREVHDLHNYERSNPHTPK